MPRSNRRSINAVLKRMLFGSDHQAIAWFELLFVTFIALFIWINQATLSYERATDYFFWPMLGPILIALRYGFGRGMMSFTLLLISVGIANNILSIEVSISLTVSVGTAVITMIIGEFRDHWNDINQRYELDHRYMDQKLKSFTQSYHLLKISHDQLEQRAAGKQMSLRTGIQMLQQIAFDKSKEDKTFLAQKSLQVLSDVIPMYQAGLYQVKDGQLMPEALAFIGNQHQLYSNDAMVKDVFECKAVLSTASFVELEKHNLHYQLVIPLVDVSGEIQGIVLAEKVNFVSLTHSNIALIALLAGCIANSMSRHLFTPILKPEQHQLFQQYIDNQLLYKHHYGADSAIVIFYDNSENQYLDLYHVTDFRRGADIYWACERRDGGQALCVLLPMATTLEAKQFIERIRDILSSKNNFNSDDLETVGPLLIFEHHQQVIEVLEDLGAFDEDLVDSSNPII